MSKKCPSCGSKKIIIDNYDFAYCIACELYAMAEKFPEQSVFDRITQSEEVLAEEFVEPYTTWAADGSLDKMWQTSFRDLSCRLFDTKEEAIAATVEKLKEVCNA